MLVLSWLVVAFSIVKHTVVINHCDLIFIKKNNSITFQCYFFLKRVFLMSAFNAMLCWSIIKVKEKGDVTVLVIKLHLSISLATLSALYGDTCWTLITYKFWNAAFFTKEENLLAKGQWFTCCSLISGIRWRFAIEVRFIKTQRQRKSALLHPCFNRVFIVWVYREWLVP